MGQAMKMQDDLKKILHRNVVKSIIFMTFFLPIAVGRIIYSHVMPSIHLDVVETAEITGSYPALLPRITANHIRKQNSTGLIMILITKYF
jgi:hypothetical protein